MTVLETIQRSTDFLTRKGVESPRLQSELMLAHVLKMPRMNLYLNFQRVLQEDEVNVCRELVQRRSEHVPLQHLVGTVSFCGIELKVSPAALIPRPETERLLEEAVLEATRIGPAEVLDFGTGTGCLAVALAVRCPQSRLWACDISEEALTLARENARSNQVEQRIEFCLGDGFAAPAPELRFDLILSNPPYIPTQEIESLQKEVRDHDPRIALDGGADGLDYYRRLARESPERLKPNGKLMVEFGDGQAAEVRSLLTDEKWIVERICADYSGRERFLIARFSG